MKIIEKINKWQQEKKVYPLLNALGGAVILKEDSIENAAVEAIVKICDPDTTDLLIDYLDDKNDQVRIAAALILGEITDIKAVKPLVKSLYDEEYYVRLSAAWALGKSRQF